MNATPPATANSVRIDHLLPETLHETTSTGAVTSPLLEACLEIRRAVFVLGQAIPLELEIDGLDAEAEHFLAVRETMAGDLAIGTARLRLLAGGAKVERVAVLEEFRGNDIGWRLMRAVEARARDLGMPCTRLHAQLAVVPFYDKLGYVAEGDVFDEAGIPHRAMHKLLA